MDKMGGYPRSDVLLSDPGDTIKIKDLEILALESFDRTCLVTTDGVEDIRGTCPDDMDQKAVNYLIKTFREEIYITAVTATILSVLQNMERNIRSTWHWRHLVKIRLG